MTNEQILIAVLSATNKKKKVSDIFNYLVCSTLFINKELEKKYFNTDPNLILEKMTNLNLKDLIVVNVSVKYSSINLYSHKTEDKKISFDYIDISYIEFFKDDYIFRLLFHKNFKDKMVIFIFGDNVSLFELKEKFFANKINLRFGHSNKNKSQTSPLQLKISTFLLLFINDFNIAYKLIHSSYFDEYDYSKKPVYNFEDNKYESYFYSLQNVYKKNNNPDIDFDKMRDLLNNYYRFKEWEKKYGTFISEDSSINENKK
jgi:hypothetical protein